MQEIIRAIDLINGPDVIRKQGNIGHRIKKSMDKRAWVHGKPRTLAHLIRGSIYMFLIPHSLHFSFFYSFFFLSSSPRSRSCSLLFLLTFLSFLFLFCTKHNKNKELNLDLWQKNYLLVWFWTRWCLCWTRRLPVRIRLDSCILICSRPICDEVGRFWIREMSGFVTLQVFVNFWSLVSGCFFRPFVCVLQVVFIVQV